MANRRILLTGATGAMGLAATRALIEAGHEVAGIARSSEGAATLTELGADGSTAPGAHRTS